MRNNKTGSQNYRDRRARLNNFLVPLSPLQHVTVASATYFFLFAIASDVMSCDIPVSAIPLMTTLSALLLIQFAKGTIQRIPVGRRRALVAVFVLLVLSVEYMDLNTRKPFARHLFLVHRGMTGADVERIMSRHLKNWVQPESEHYLHLDPHFTGEAWYRHTTEWWGNTDWGKVGFKDGRVVSAEICLCD